MVDDVADPVVAALVKPTCADFITTTRRAECAGESASMIARI